MLAVERYRKDNFAQDVLTKEYNVTCKVIVNADSGNYARLDIDRLLKNLGCDNTELETIDSGKDWSADGYDSLIVCGGDGTLHNAITKGRGKKIIYAPCGTLNETAHTDNPITCLGQINDEFFSYVAACGSFTEIGYSAKNKNKKKFKSIAYLPQVIKSYRCHEIDAKLNVDGNETTGKFTLIMALKSNRCFGFKFNKSYNKNKGLYLLAIRSLGKDNLTNRIRMFAPFFRVFFCGVNKPQINENWLLVPFEQLTVELKTPQTFCLDGEKRVLSGNLKLCTHTLENAISVVKPPFLPRKRRKKF